MPHREVYEVDVPIHHTSNPALRGIVTEHHRWPV